MVTSKTNKIDTLEHIGKTVIQHGKNNNRVYLIKLDPEADAREILEYLDKLCIENSYSKSFLKIRAADYPLFFMNGYRIEAFIPDFFKNNDDCIFACRYYCDESSVFSEFDMGGALEAILSQTAESSSDARQGQDGGFIIKKALENDAASLAGFYAGQFPNYPFPVSDPGFIVKSMEKGTDYFIITDNSCLIAAASAEKDMEELNAEITDFAVTPGYRGYGLAGKLMEALENHLDKSPVKTLYTIARLNSPAMNAVFSKNNYKYSGTLVNNTNISTGIESMNVWYKHI